jgi:hypothetical protein
MKTMQLNWKRSIAAFSLLALVNTPDRATGLEAPSPAAPLVTQSLREKLQAEENKLQHLLKRYTDVHPLVQAERGVVAEIEHQLAAPLRQKLEAELEKFRQLKSKYTDLNPLVLSEREVIARLENQLSDSSAPSTGAPPQPPANVAPAPQPTPSAESAKQQEVFRRRYGLGGVPGVAPTSPPAGPEASLRGAQLEARLKEIVLPEVSFDGLPLNEVLRNLRDEVEKRDPQKPKGINFLINPNTPSTLVSGLVDPATGLPAAMLAPEPVDVSSVNIKLNMPLHNVRMKDVLDAIVKVADKPIEYTLEDYAVVFSLRRDAVTARPGAPHFPLSVRTFKVDTNTFVAGLESAFGIKVESATPASIGARSRKIQAALKELLTQLGISMEPNKAVFYNELTGVVMVRATVDDLEVVRAAIETLGGTNTEPALTRQ